ncbi:MAG TPA: RluA family pseudouridine synthase [Candidatus Binatia bacterium]|nr:RluA family pseudouridine synthase [Candidatus Binatia bacterium]
MPQEIVIPAGEAPKRLENFLKKHFNIGYVRKLFRKNGVRLNGKHAAAEDIARPGDRIQLYIPYEKSKPGARPAGELDIVFEDDEVLVLNKPSGIAVHEGKGILKRDTILGRLEAAYRSRGIAPKLVHRIDKDTSGLLVAAKNDQTAERLERLFDTGDVEKEYLALVAGRLPAKRDTIDAPLPGREGRPVTAVTHYKAEREFPGAVLARVRIDTGRMHQIRLHFASIHHPVVMDDEHGDFAFNKEFRKKFGLKRQFLHASMIAFEHRGKMRKWTAELPEDLARTLERLERS